MTISHIYYLQLVPSWCD